MKYKYFILMFAMILLVGTVSAELFQFDNVVSEGEIGQAGYPNLAIENTFGLGATMWEGELKNNSDICGQDCFAINEITLNKKGSLVDEIKFLTLQEDGGWVEQPIRGYKFYIENNSEWIDYNLGEELSIGTYKVKLEGKKKPSRTVDWQIKSNGKWLDAWAVWGPLFNGTEYQLTVIGTGINEAGLEINSVFVTQLGSGMWKINTSNVDDEISRALIMKTLFYGTDGSDPRSTSQYINATEVYSNLNRDNGNRGHYIEASRSTGSGATLTLTGNFSDTTNNNYCASWSRINHNGFGPSAFSRWEVPEGTALNYHQGASTGIFDEIGTNRVADEKTNPVDAQAEAEVWGSLERIKAILFCTGNITWLNSGFTTNQTKDFYLDEGFPIVQYPEAFITLNSPANNYISPTSQVTFNASAEIVDGANVTNMSLWTNISGSWAISNTTTGINSNLTTQTWINTLPSDGSYLWTVQACDSDGDCGFANENRTVFLDNVPPTINITYPNGTIQEGTIGNEILNWTITDAQGNLDSCWYDYNGTNQSVTCGDNTTTFSLEQNNYNLTMYANDTLGNLNSSFTNWNYSFLKINETYNNPVTEGSTQNFTLWLQSNQGISLVNLVYDGTSYAGTYTDAGGFLYKLDRSITIPGVTADTNKSFYWNVTLQDSSTFATSSLNQTITNLGIDNCSTYTNMLFNYTIYDEESKSMLNGTGDNTSLETNVEIYSLGDYGETPVIQLNESIDQENPVAICLENPITDSYYMDVITEYSATGYNQEYYYIQKGTLNSSEMANNISLYLLNSSQSTLTVLKVQDSAQNPIQDVILQIQRYDIGTDTFYTVGMAKTDFNGQDLVYLNWYDTLYKFVLLQNNSVVQSTTPYKILETPQTFTIADAVTFPFLKFRDFEYSLYYNNATENFVLTFVKPSALVSQGCLRVTKRTMSNDTEICNVCETSSSATLYCNVADQGNGTYIASFLAYGSFELVDWISENIGQGFSSQINELIGNEDGTFYALLLSGIVMAMFFINPVLGIMGLLLGLLASAVMGFVLVNYLEFLGVVIVGMIIIWMIKK